MKKSLFLLMFSVTIQNVFAQDGILDMSFGANGIVTTDISSNDDRASSVIVQSDNKILLVGMTSTTSASNMCILRYLPNGILDDTFGSNGKVITNITGYSQGNDINLQQDGKIVVVGTEQNTSVMLRFNTDGTPDTSFGMQGKVINTFSGFYSTANVLAIQPDSKIVIAGTIYSQDDSASGFIGRYNNDGSPDNSFGINGIVINASGGKAETIKIQPDSKILIFESFFAPMFSIIRYNADGTIDTGFGINGTVTGISNTETYMNDLTVLNDGKIVIAGEYRNSEGGFDSALMRYNSAGIPDNSFGNNGLLTIPEYQNLASIKRLLLQNGNKIVLGGAIASSNANANADFLIARVNDNGSFDPSFGNGGNTSTFVGSNNTFFSDLAFAPDGSIVAAGQNGNVDYNIVLAKYINTNLKSQQFNSGNEVVSVYPNPARAFITIDYGLKIPGTVSMKIHDLTGKLISEPVHQARRNKGSNSETISLKNLASGAYLLSLETSEGGQTFRIIKL